MGTESILETFYKLEEAGLLLVADFFYTVEQRLCAF